MIRLGTPCRVTTISNYTCNVHHIRRHAQEPKDDLEGRRNGNPRQLTSRCNHLGEDPDGSGVGLLGYAC